MDEQVTTIFARAFPESIRITETYFYDQEISRNPSIRPGRTPTGHIQVVVPYDGYQYFTRVACQDVEHGLRDLGSERQVEALIGHLSLSNYRRTDLQDALDLGDHYGSIPLRVPVRGSGIESVDQLRDDQRSCVITYDYAPLAPEVTPLTIEMNILDEDVLTTHSTDLEEAQAKELSKLVSAIAQQVSFRRNLLLLSQVKLILPAWQVSGPISPILSRMSIGWPTMTSFRALHLTIGDDEAQVTYNPLTRALEWFDVPFSPGEIRGRTDLKVFATRPMCLLIDQPGELYQQASLDGQVEIEIPDQLLSGLQARFYTAVGGLSTTHQPEMVTRLIADLHLILDDAFMKRTLSPYQHLFFEGVIPDEMRISDISTALKDRGFEVKSSVPLRHAQDHLTHFIYAERPEGPEKMKLWVYIEGKRYTTERQTQVPGGQTYTSTFESGELKVYMRGEMPRNASVITHEMNAFQAALRDRFERLRAKR